MSLKLLLPWGVELTMLAFNTFSFWRHPRSLDVHTLHVTLHLVVARQQLSTDGTRNLLPTFQLLHLVHVFHPLRLTDAIFNVEVKVSLLDEFLVASGARNRDTTVFPLLVLLQVNAGFEHLCAEVTLKTQVHMGGFNMSLEVHLARVFIFTLITFVVLLSHVENLVVFLHSTSIPECLTTGRTQSWSEARLNIVLVPLPTIILLHVTLKALLKTKRLLAARTT